MLFSKKHDYKIHWDTFYTGDRNVYIDSTRDRKEYPSLNDEISTQVLVVGGGYTGLACALHLNHLGYDVTVIERHHVGWGASGRNGGQVQSGYQLEYSNMESRYGELITHQAHDQAEEGMQQIRDWIDEFGIDCEKQDGVICVSLSEGGMRSQLEKMEREKAYWGDSVEPMDAATLKKNIGSSFYMGGLHDKQAFHINPMKYVVGLAKAAAARGVRIYENTPAEVILTGDMIKVYTASGAINCKHLVLCGSAYQGTLIPELRSKNLLLRTSMVATEPLPKNTSVLKGGQAVYEDCFNLYYFRKSADNRLIFGGGDSIQGLEKDRSRQEDIIQEVLEDMHLIYPQVRDNKITHVWGGYLGVTVSQMPLVGKLKGTNIYHAGGYCGHGSVPSHVAARAIAEAIDGRPGRISTFRNFTTMTIPGMGRFDPLIGRMALAWYRFLDRNA